ncbi:hypothetical protein MYBA111488_03685 [Mycobacterium basiliense]
MISAVVQPFPAPHLSADLHDFPGAADRGVEFDTIKSLDHLRPGGTDSEVEPAIRHEI